MTRILHSIWRVLFSIWYLAIFTSLTILTAFFALILCGLSMALVRRISGRLWSIICLAPARIRVETVGRERLPESAGGGYIIFANHRSLLDIPTVTAATDQSISWVAKAALGRIPVFGWALKRIHLLVDRGGSAEAAKAMIAEAGTRLSRGEILAIFPEGTRNKTDAPLLPFKKGAFILAKHAGVPLVPLAIARSGDLWPGGHLVPKSGLIKVAIGEPMIVSPGETLNQISKRAYEILESLYLSLQDEGAPKPVDGGEAEAPGEGGETLAPVVPAEE
jgi:1-acyl-sn-glycerol-3-phosphate acyltransferase